MAEDISSNFTPNKDDVMNAEAKIKSNIPIPYADPRYNKVPTPMTEENSDAYAASMNRTYSRPKSRY